jgi:calcium-translocating P-type ATPase
VSATELHDLEVEAAFRALRSGPEGLAPAEAARRLASFGPNDLARMERPSRLRSFAAEFTHFFALILWVGAALAFFAAIRQPGSGMATLGFAIVGVIAINGAFSFWQQYRAERALEALEKLLPSRVEVVRAGFVQEVEAREIAPGDLLILEAGDRVPADCRVVESVGIRVNNATLTGESVPVPLDPRPSAERAPLRATNVALAGTSIVSGHGRGLVYATGAATEFSRIAQLAQATRAGLSPLQREIVRLTRVVAALATLLGVSFFAVGQAIGLPFWSNVLFAIGIIVANVPEGLLPTVTLSLAMASQRMARRDALVRHLPAVESLGAATVICTDKTGTLTQNRMAVRRLFIGGAPLEVREETLAALGAAHRAFFEACFLCENTKEVGGPEAHELLGDPMEVALVETARRAVPGLAELPRVDEIPFDSDRRRLSTLHRTSRGLLLHTKGALAALLPLCEAVEVSGRAEPLVPAWRERILAAERALAEEGLRVLAVASRTVAEGYRREALERGLRLLGLVALEDPPRPEVPDAIRRCREAGIKVIMVTGDHPSTAAAVAREVGLATAEGALVIEGSALRRMSEAELLLALGAPEVLFARVDADQKTRLVTALQRAGEVVAVTGDGVNDAPALVAGDIGVAMGRTGTDVARAAADLVLADDNFASIVDAVEEGRAVYANIRKFLTYILTSNVPEIVPYLAFALFGIPLPLTIMQILAVDLGTDMVPALGLGAERPSADVMRRPPRSRKERLLSRALLLRAYGFLGVLEAVAAMAAYFYVLVAGGWTFGQGLAGDDPLYREATTACLSAIVATQVVNVFLCRGDRESAWGTGVGGNPLLLLGVGMEIALILAIDYTWPGHWIFATVPLGAEAWLFILPFAAAMLLLEELRKLLLRRRGRLPT